jgi:hypothetical protein
MRTARDAVGSLAAIYGLVASCVLGGTLYAADEESYAARCAPPVTAVGICHLPYGDVPYVTGWTPCAAG